MNSTATTNTLLMSFFPWHQTRLIEQAGGEVARECRADLWNRVRCRAMSMSTPEIRGYVRAYAVGCAANQVDQVLNRWCLKPALRLQVLASGVEQLVSMAVRDALSDEMPTDVKPMAA
jgi:hypothetical protein